MSDEMDFFMEDDSEDVAQHTGHWNILIVDDDAAVHEATKFALSGFTFLNKSIRWLDAYSSQEAKEILKTETDIALLFLDVVMETDDAGLKFACWFRDEMINPSTRIILRTGQPGQAPERQIIVNYDLHDYKTKTELNSDKLFTTTVAALRAYYDMHRLEMTRAGLEGIISVSGDLFQIQSMYEYARNVLSQISSILDIRSSGIICAQSTAHGNWETLAKVGDFNTSYDDIISIITKSENIDTTYKENEYLIKIINTKHNVKYAIYLEPSDILTDIQTKMIMMFCNNISIGLNNIKLYGSLTNSHKATVMSLAQITEFRDKDTGEHIFRIARGTELLAKELYARDLYLNELNNNLIEIIGLSSTLHDIGKVAMPDEILLKPGALTPQEFEIIKQHSEIGGKVLQSAIKYAGEDVDYLEAGRRIALYHHERWDGKGYPAKKAGTDIPIEARIASIIDVFDALLSKRCYKPAFTLDDCLSIIKEGSGTAFDPVIVDVFLSVYKRLLS